jgi:hypothetical protein
MSVQDDAVTAAREALNATNAEYAASPTPAKGQAVSDATTKYQLAIQDKDGTAGTRR